jgi:hypothetical protein
MSEIESHQRLLAGDLAWYEAYLTRLGGFLAEVKPTAVLFDAFEFENVHHDLCCAIATAACLRTGVEYDLAHLPLACNSSLDTVTRPYAEYDRAGWECRYVALGPEEVSAKRRLVEAAAQRAGGELRAHLGQIAGDRWRFEPYRPAPEPHTLGSRPATYGWPTWEETGQGRVREGKYRRAIHFDDHFVPLLRSLGLLG